MTPPTNFRGQPLKEDGCGGGLSHDGVGHGFFYYHTPM
jgi:hypothetical protein